MRTRTALPIRQGALLFLLAALSSGGILMTRSLLSLVVVGLAICGSWLSGCSEESPRRQDAPSPLQAKLPRAQGTSAEHDALEALKREVVALQKEQTRLFDSLRAMAAELAHVRRAAEQAQLVSVAREEVLAGEEAQNGDSEKDNTFSTALDSLDQQFAQEHEDLRWSQEAELAIVLLLQSTEGSQLISVECRATLCQLELHHTDATAQQWLLTHLPQESPFDGQRLIREVEDDPETPRTLIYLARAGYELSID